MSCVSESYHELELSDQKINKNKNKPRTRKFVMDAEMHAKLEILVKEAMEQYNNKIKEKEQEKKIKKKNK